MCEAIRMTSFGCKLFIALYIFRRAVPFREIGSPGCTVRIFLITVFQTVPRNDIYNYGALVKDIHATVADLQ